MIRRTLAAAVPVLALAALAGCGDDPAPSDLPAYSASASASASRAAADPAAGATAGGTWTDPRQLPDSELPDLPGYTYVPSEPASDLELPEVPDPPAIRGVLLGAVAPEGKDLPEASLEVVRLAPGLDDDALDDLVVAAADGLGGRSEAATVEGTAVRTVDDLQVLGMSVVVLRRGDDLALVFSPEAATARDVAAAYLAT